MRWRKRRAVSLAESVLNAGVVRLLLCPSALARVLVTLRGVRREMSALARVPRGRCAAVLRSARNRLSFWQPSVPA